MEVIRTELFRLSMIIRLASLAIKWNNVVIGTLYFRFWIHLGFQNGTKIGYNPLNICFKITFRFTIVFDILLFDLLFDFQSRRHPKSCKNVGQLFVFVLSSFFLCALFWDRFRPYWLPFRLVLVPFFQDLRNQGPMRKTWVPKVSFPILVSFWCSF